jgi:hypothetical protein
LPKEIKAEATVKAKAFVERIGEEIPLLRNLVTDAINFAEESHTWATAKDQFFKHTNSIDNIRDESLWKTFPELNRMKDALE